MLLLSFDAFGLHWCFHLECCHQIGKLLMCAPDMLHPFQLGSRLTMTYQLQSPWWCEVEKPEHARTNISKLQDPHPQCHWEEVDRNGLYACLNCSWA